MQDELEHTKISAGSLENEGRRGQPHRAPRDLGHRVWYSLLRNKSWIRTPRAASCFLCKQQNSLSSTPKSRKTKWGERGNKTLYQISGNLPSLWKLTLWVLLLAFFGFPFSDGLLAISISIGYEVKGWEYCFPDTEVTSWWVESDFKMVLTPLPCYSIQSIMSHVG